MSTPPKRTYTDSFKKEAVRLVLEEGYSRSAAAKSLGISDKNISRWCKEYEKKDSNSSSSTLSQSEKEELKQLRAENRRLLMERDILKKAAAFFVKESQ